MRRNNGKFCGAMNDTLQQRFWSRVEKSDGCWLWTWGRDADGYGLMRYRYKNHRTHRLSWELANGRRVPQGMVVCHRCDNPTCVNPSHLFLGTAKENTADMVAKRRHVYGERNPKAVLVPAQIFEIRNLLAAGAARSAIAKTYGVSKCTINDIHKGRSWRHL